MTKTNSLSLSQLQVQPYDSSSSVAKEFPAFHLFDDRHDFMIFRQNAHLAVKMVYLNEKKFSCESAESVHRLVSISILDATEGEVICRTTFYVSLSKDELTRAYRKDLPFAYHRIDSGHIYKVLVRDEASKEILGEKTIHLFDLPALRQLPTKWYKVTEACLVQHNLRGFTSYVSIKPEDYSIYMIRFGLLPQFRENLSVLPELEIRLHHPDGHMDKTLCRPEEERNKDYSNEKRHHVEMRFLVQPYQRGIYYAELWSMNYPIAGFAFSTNGPEVRGSWTEEQGELDRIASYTPEEGAKRFARLLSEKMSFGASEAKEVEEEEELESQAATEQADDRTDEIPIDDFDKRVDAFIASVLAKKNDKEPKSGK